jgi:biopolymer transport protein ExbB
MQGLPADTFKALSSGGLSDPAAVSRGPGTALRATAIGIAAALLGHFWETIC